jgi:hypothetical protein
MPGFFDFQSLATGGKPVRLSGSPLIRFIDEFNIYTGAIIVKYY